MKKLRIREGALINQTSVALSKSFRNNNFNILLFDDSSATMEPHVFLYGAKQFDVQRIEKQNCLAGAQPVQPKKLYT